MELRIVAVGRVRESYFADGIAEYVKRAKRWASVDIVEIDDYAVKESARGAEQEAMEREADAILPKIKGHCVVLDIDGELLTSPGLAQICDRAFLSAPAITFVIGGSYGLSPRVKARADTRLSFGRVTFPHQLVRLMVAEQIYRTLAILHNHPYHK